MARRLLDYDPTTETQTWHSYDQETRVTKIETVQNVAPYLRVNEAERNRDTATSGGLNSISRRQIKAGRWHVARIPTEFQAAYARARGIPDPMWIYKRAYEKELRRMLNDPTFAGLRTNPGRV